MNRVTHALLRLVCCVKGHRPFPARDIPVTPKEPPNPFTIGNVTAGTGLALNASGSWTTINTTGAASHSIDHNGVNFSCGPVQATAKICSRCHGVYWNSTIKGQWFNHVKALPELDYYMKWQDRQTWETKQRAKNELAEKLYQQYQVALKLAHVPGESDEQA